MRNDHQKKGKTSFGIIDAKSIKNADTAKEKGYNAGKKVPGIKLHIAVDTLGLPHAIHITCANITDRKGAETMVVLHLEDPSSISNFLVDGGYSGEKFARAISEIHGASVEVVKRNVIIVISQQTAKDRKLSSLLVFHPVRIQSTTG